MIIISYETFSNLGDISKFGVPQACANWEHPKWVLGLQSGKRLCLLYGVSCHVEIFYWSESSSETLLGIDLGRFLISRIRTFRYTCSAAVRTFGFDCPSNPKCIYLTKLHANCKYSIRNK